MKKHKIPLQLYNVFTLGRPNRSEGLQKHTFDKPNRSEGLQKQKIPLQLYALFDAKTTFYQPKLPKPFKPVELYAQNTVGPIPAS